MVMQSGTKHMNNGNSFFNLEQRLSNSLKPVKPDPEFLASLKGKLSRTPSILLETSKKQIGLLVFGAGLFTGAFILWIIGRFKKK